METLDQRRRKQGAPIDDAEGAAMEGLQAYETALGQAGVCAKRKGLGPRGQVKPMFLEGAACQMGVVAMGVVASPFHSQKIHEEVRLQRSRPASLDSDARALGYGTETSSAALEAEYAYQLSSKNVRVARVETTSPESSSPPKRTEEMRGSLGHAGEGTGGSLSSYGPGVPRALRPLERAEGSEGTTLALVATGLRKEEERPDKQALALVEQPELAVAVLEGETQRPPPGDQRELVPAGIVRWKNF